MAASKELPPWHERVCLVTGGARGIGAAVADRLAKAGARVVRADISYPDKEDLAPSDQSGYEVHVDVALSASVERMVRSTLSELGRIDVLVTCAGVYGVGPLETMTESEWRRVLDINLTGTFFCMQQVWPTMVEHQIGRIVCIGSTAGHTGGQLAGPHYAASKAGVHALVKWSAKAGATEGINVNAVAPGVVDTDLIKGQQYSTANIPLGRLAQPQEIAAAVEFLVSASASYITGTVLDVNGGSFLR